MGVDLIFLSLNLDQRPVLELNIEGKRILGLLDTGADRSIIAKKDWPSGWPVQSSSQTFQGLGYAKTPDMSARQLKWQDQEGHSGVVQPYVLELPISLWGRDLLKDMGFKLSNEYSLSAQRMMQDMGYAPGFGIGKTSKIQCGFLNALYERLAMKTFLGILMMLAVMVPG
ncbi:endogenous retrovirus group K member 6 Pro protein-like [Grammomys surdaster]|uniref:endogenous retrovirus group K member 6 Pro protein-like n=1 Tax=Grammomys surdaster TaxID=491861 RepID=UPI00109F1088|nr:endogenous retrovirus group K member 6 Pro protein-like [Grammomys surdaster]